MIPVKIACIGECMVELSPLDSNSYTKGVAGDTLNTAIYLKRSLKDRPVEVSYVTALGKDPLSYQLETFIEGENLDCSLIGKVDDKQPGLYSIELDASGERSFNYWRNDSAARKLLDGGLTKQQQQELVSRFDLIYLSGISLAILDSDSRHRLSELLALARSKGTKIAFDSNYRPRLWESPEIAQEQVNKLLHHVDIALVTFDDEQLLYGDKSPDDVLARLQEAGVQEIIVKDGAEGCWISNKGKISFVPAVSVANIVDTTSAGDSFNAGYLAARTIECPPDLAAVRAHSLASQVIQHKGAIIPADHCPQIEKENV